MNALARRGLLCTCQASVVPQAGPSFQRLKSTQAHRPDSRTQTRASIALARKHDDLSFADRRRPERGAEDHRGQRPRPWARPPPVRPLYVELRRAVRAFKSANELLPMLKTLARTLSIDENELATLYGTWAKKAEAELNAVGRQLDKLSDGCAQHVLGSL